jgi:hypothetical protein
MPTEVPDKVDPKGTYMLSGEFINQILDWMNEHELSIDDEDNSPLRIREIGPQGTVLGLDTTEC